MANPYRGLRVSGWQNVAQGLFGTALLLKIQLRSRKYKPNGVAPQYATPQKKLESGVQLLVFYEAPQGVLQKTLEAGVGWKLPTTATSKWMPLRFSALNQLNRSFPPNFTFLKLELDGNQILSLVVLQLLLETAPKWIYWSETDFDEGEQSQTSP